MSIFDEYVFYYVKMNGAKVNLLQTIVLFSKMKL